MKREELFDLLEERYTRYNTPAFIADDPIGIPGSFTRKEDIEVSAFLTSVIAWGQRKTIIRNGEKLLEMMDGAPGDFVRNFKPADLKPFHSFVHRTFNGDDCITFLHGLQRIYRDHGGLERAMKSSFSEDAQFPGKGWSTFKSRFFDMECLPRTHKHLPDPMKGSAAKRMNMFLRWMVRQDDRGVDFGIWRSFSPAELYLPLDVHTARQGRRLGLLERKQDDWKAVLELTGRLREIDPEDPVKYDFALFGMGIWG